MTRKTMALTGPATRSLTGILAVSAAIALLGLGTLGCSQKPGLRIREAAPPGAPPPEAAIVKTAALLPLLNRTEFKEAPIIVGKALVDAISARAPFALIRPEEVPGRIAPLYELGVVPRFISDVDEGARTSPEVARLVGQGLKADAVMVANVTFFQQYVDHLPDGKPGEAYVTIVGGEIHLIDAKTGTALWSAAKVRKDRAALGFPSLEGTAQALAADLVATLPD
ncbi:MAG: hypothetical protein FJZ00_02175 [Candidatus Sericytochromatia bacterium]|uniref:Lipoprotein n=1 Tax=Candidatus Tanganyikabacteria bacterium TaxID=2961651 RepID=A0A938BI16_9BACT|nr:hypothetical protein [Candidatus Tanganyikabacteria bacterium]